MDKSVLSDERLVSLHRQKKINAFFTFYTRYRSYGYAIVQKYVSKSRNYHSLIEEKDSILITSIEESINTFDLSKGSFRTLLSKIIEHKTLNLIRDFNKNPLSNSVSIDNFNNEDDEYETYESIAFADSGASPNQKITIMESKMFIKSRFSKQVNKMILLKEAGFTYEEIAQHFKLSHKAVRSIFYRVRKAINKKISEKTK